MLQLLIVILVILGCVAVLLLLGLRIGGWTMASILGKAPPKAATPEYATVSPEDAARTPYPYVFVESDGSARELHTSEREYLEERFAPTDGARPYVKSRYQSRTPTGDLKGFCARSALPRDRTIGPAPADSPRVTLTREEYFAQLEREGHTLDRRPDGTVVVNLRR